MKFTITRIHLKDFLSHKSTTVDLRQGQRVLVHGQSGAGKSGIVEALTWVLYGEGRADNRSLIRSGAKSAEVTLSLGFDKRELVVQRLVTQEGKHSLSAFLDGNPAPTVGIRETQAWLENLLGCPRELFVNSVMTPQDRSESFVSANAAKRKEILLSMVATLDIEPFLKRAREKFGELTGTVATLQAFQSSQCQRRDHELAYVEGMPEAELSLARADAEYQAADAAVAVLGDERAEYELAEQQVNSARRQEQSAVAALKTMGGIYDTAHRNWTRANERLSALPTLEAHEDVAVLEERVKQANDIKARLSGAERELASLQATLTGHVNSVSRIDAKIRELNERALPDCPKIGGKCVIAEQALTKELETQRSDKRELAELVDHLNDKISRNIATQKKLQDDLAQHFGVEKLLQEARTKTALLAQKPQLEFDLDTYHKEKERAADMVTDAQGRVELAAVELGKATERFKAVQSSRPKLLEAETRLSQALTQLTSAKSRVDRCREAVRTAKELQKELSESRVQLDQARQDVEAVGLVKDALGQGGIKAVAADILLPEVESRANAVLARLSPMRLRLTTQRQGNSGGVTEGLFITVVSPGGRAQDYDCYSGGERLKIAVAITEALSELQKFGFRVVDELYAGLDEESTEGFVKVLLSLHDRYSQMLCISHLRQVQDVFTDVLEVTKDQDGVSTANFR